MFNKSVLTLFITAALALHAAARPSPLPTDADSFTSIPVRKRTLTREDGVFDFEKARIDAMVTKNKHQRNKLNLQRNIANAQMADPQDLAQLSSSAPSGSEPLVDEGQDNEWTGPICVGSRAQSFVIDFDTGSSDLWIPSSKCTSQNCETKHKYDASTSTTSIHRPGNFSIKYGDNSTVAGEIYTDTVNVAGIIVKDQYMAAATVLSDLFAHDPADGILGLAFPLISRLKQTPFFQMAISQKVVSSPVFGFYLASQGSELHLGGTNDKLYKGSIERHEVIIPKGSLGPAFWQIGDGRINVNGHQNVLQGFHTIIDSGTTIIYGSPSDVSAVYSRIPGSRKATNGNGNYAFPCDNVPDVSFSWGGKDWPISAKNFNLGRESLGSSMCVGAIAVQVAFKPGMWLLGDSFMKNVYSAFDMSDPATVGFAELTHGP